MTNPSPPIPHPPFTSLPPNPNPNPNPSSEPNSSSSQLRNPQPQGLAPSLSSTLSSLDDLIRRSERSVQSLLSLLPIQNPNRAGFDGLVSCPFDSRHLMPPNSLFSHFLRCSSSQFQLRSDLLPHVNYPETLKPSDSSRTEDGAIQTLHGSGSELCFSLDDFYADFGSGFIYRDCHCVVSLSSLDGMSRTFSLPGFLSVECANFVSSGGRDSEGSERDQRKILPSEFWAIRAEVEAWNECPSVYSYRVLWVLSGLDVIRDCDIGKWIIANSPQYGIVVDEPMRDHMSLLCCLCLKAIRKEALISVDIRDSNKTLGNMSFSCPVLVQSLMWLATQLSVLYGEMGAKLFALNILKNCILDAALSLLIFSWENEAVKSSDLEEFPCSSDAIDTGNEGFEVSRALEIRRNEEPINKVGKSIANGVIFVSQVAAAIAALHERSLLEEKIKGHRFHQPLNNYQRTAEYDYVSRRADEERRRRPQYRPIIEHDGIPQLRSSNEGTSKARTREELLAEERDYKRRRMSYRGKKVKRSNLEVMRDIIEDYMDEIKQAGGIGCFEKGIEREDALSSKAPGASELTADISMLRENNHHLNIVRDDSPNHGMKQSYSDYGPQSTTFKGQFDKDYDQPRRRHHEDTEDERSISRQKRDRESYSRRSRDKRSTDWTHQRMERNRTSGSETEHRDSKHTSSRTSRYHDSRSTASILTSEYRSKHKDGRHTDRYESYSSEPLSRNTFGDRYDPSESPNIYEDDVSTNSKYARRFYEEK